MPTKSTTKSREVTHVPHIHTEPDQHDMTVSAYVLRRVDNQWLCLIHWHKKGDVYMQLGGHIELNQTPWQAVADELEQESGYRLEDVRVYQPNGSKTIGLTNIAHPVPFSMNTHSVGDEHFHSDLVYGFLAADLPSSGTAADESTELRWCTIVELEQLRDEGAVLADVVEIYRLLIDYTGTYQAVDTGQYSLEKPKVSTFTYKRGKPSENRNH